MSNSERVGDYCEEDIVGFGRCYPEMAQSDEQQVDAPRTVNEILKTNHGEATKKIAGETGITKPSKQSIETSKDISTYEQLKQLGRLQNVKDVVFRYHRQSFNEDIDKEYLDSFKIATLNNGNIVLVRVCSGIPEYVIIDGRCISREEQGSYEDAFGFAIKFIFRTEDGRRGASLIEDYEKKARDKLGYKDPI